MGKSVVIGVIPSDRWVTAKELIDISHYDFSSLPTMKVILGKYFKKGKIERRHREFPENYTGHKQYEYRLKQVDQNTETL